MNEMTDMSSSSHKQTRRSARKFVDTTVLELKDVKEKESLTVSSEEEDVEVPKFQFAPPKSVSSSRKNRGEFCVGLFSSILL